MADPRFFAADGPFPLARLAEIAGAELSGGVDPNRTFNDVAPLDEAGADDVSFLDNKRYVKALETSRAGAVILHPDHAKAAPEGMALLLTEAPYKAYALVAQLFHPVEQGVPGLHPAAIVDPGARLGAECAVGPGAVIGPGAQIGARVRIDANAVIGANVVIGARCRIGAGASLSHCILGEDVVLHPGVRIGQEGFGFASDETGHTKVPQLGRVVIGDRVEIGANSTVDRGSGPDTVIGAGCMIDNLVQIGHNVKLGPGCVVVAQVGIAGSTKLGRGVVLGGQVGIAGHLTIGDGAQVAAFAGVMRDLPGGQAYAGAPAVPVKQAFRQVAALARLANKKSDT